MSDEPIASTLDGLAAYSGGSGSGDAATYDAAAAAVTAAIAWYTTQISQERASAAPSQATIDGLIAARAEAAATRRALSAGDDQAAVEVLQRYAAVGRQQSGGA